MSGEEVVDLLTFAATTSQDCGGHLRIAPGTVTGGEAGDAPDGAVHALAPETRTQNR